MDIATKRNLISVAKWVGFWGVYALIDIFLVEAYTGFSLLELVVGTPEYYTLILTAFWAFLLGEFEARYYHYKPESDKYNEHFSLALSRGCFFLLVLGLTNVYTFIGSMLIFPFFHDGAYYTQRHNMNKNIYPKTWFDQSTTSRALMTKVFTPLVRVISLIVGVLIGVIFLNLIK